MHIHVSKADVLQSIGFALTAAKEELDRVKSNINNGILAMLTDGVKVTDDMQEPLIRALTVAHEQVNKLDALRRMAEFANEERGVMLDRESFELLECNLPAR